MSQTSLPVLLRHLYADRKSGTLRLSAQGSRRRLHFRKGAVVFVDEGDDVPAPTREGAEALLFSLFSWTWGEFAFDEGEPLVDDELAFTRPPWELILEGSRSVEDARILGRCLGTEGTLFACSETTELPLFRIKLAPAERAVLAHARTCERFSSAELSQIGAELPVKRALNTLVSIGLLQIVHLEEVPESEPDPPPAPQVTHEPAPALEPEIQLTAEPAEPDEEPQPETRLLAEPETSLEPQPLPEPAPVSPLSFDAVPSEVEELLDSFPSRRPRSVPGPPTRPKAPVEPPPLGPAPRENVEKAAEVEPPKTAPLPAPAEPPPVEVPVAPLPSPAPVRMRAIPQSASKLPLLGAVGAVLVVGALVVLLWPSSDEDERTAAQPVVAAAEPRPREPESPAEEAASGPSEAELFYHANLAVERGDLEQAREELAKLLARRPDFSAARELLARVDRDLLTRALPPPPAPPAPKPQVAPSAPAPQRTAAEPPRPGAAAPLGESEQGGAGGELDTTEGERDDLRVTQPVPPLDYRARHDHRIGGCEGVLSFSADGIGYRSGEHEWLWSFSELAKTDRKDERRLRIETRAKKSFNFELEEPLRESDWTRFLALQPR